MFLFYLPILFRLIHGLCFTERLRFMLSLKSLMHSDNLWLINTLLFWRMAKSQGVGHGHKHYIYYHGRRTGSIVNDQASNY